MQLSKLFLYIILITGGLGIHVYTYGQQAKQDSIFLLQSDGSFIYKQSDLQYQPSRNLEYILSFTPRTTNIGYRPYSTGFSPAENGIYINGLPADNYSLTRTQIDRLKIYQTQKPLNYFPRAGMFTDMITNQSPQPDTLIGEYFGTPGTYQQQVGELLFRKSLLKRQLQFTGGGNYIKGNEYQSLYNQIFTLNEKGKQFLLQNPMAHNPNGKFDNNLINLDQYYLSRNAGLMSGDYQYNAHANLTYIKGPSLFTIYGLHHGQKNNIYIPKNAALNADDNPISTASNTLVSGQWDYRFSKDFKHSLSVKMYIANQYEQVEHPRLGNKVFEYNYAGIFKTFKNDLYQSVRPSPGNPSQTFHIHRSPFTQKDTDYSVTLSNYIVTSGQYDSLTTFTASGENPQHAAYDSYIYNYQQQQGDVIHSKDELYNLGGIRNGDPPRYRYNFLNAPGFYNTSYMKRNTARAGLQASWKYVLKIGLTEHKLEVGLQYQRTSQRSYELEADKLWQLMRSVTGADNPQPDTGLVTLTYDQNHTFTDTVKLGYTVDHSKEHEFTRNLRSLLIQQGAKDANGKPIDQNSAIDVDLYNPSIYNLGLFQANELFPLVHFSGYDYRGNRVRTNDFGNIHTTANPAISSYINNTMGLYIYDRVTWKDFHMEWGLRLDIYGSNQYTLQDPYSFRRLKTLDQLRAENSPLVQSIPAGVPGSYSVYVNDIYKPTKILGFRKPGENAEWFNDKGQKIQTPDPLIAQTSNGKIAPLLVDTNPGVDFKPAKRQAVLQPMIKFDVPINRNTRFYGLLQQTAYHHSELMQLQILNFIYYQNQQTPFQTGNPNLSPTRNLVLETGFRQCLSDRILFNICFNWTHITGIPELKNMNYVYPYNYSTWSNAGNFSSKSLRLHLEYVYEFLHLVSSYQLQFNSTDKLVGNIAYSYPVTFDSRHQFNEIIKLENPFKNSRSFKNMYMMLNILARSGQPYDSSSLKWVFDGTQDNPDINSPNARTSWVIQADLSLGKTLYVFKKKTCNVYITVQNILNRKNSWAIFTRTGNLKDDGYLASPEGKQTASQQVNAANFNYLYQLQMINPQWQALPFTIRAGVVVGL